MQHISDVPSNSSIIYIWGLLVLFGEWKYQLLYNTLSFKCHGFDLKYLFTIMLKVQSPTVKVSERIIAIFGTESNFNSVLRPAADSNGVTMEIKRKVEYDGAFSFEPLIPGFRYTR